MNDLLRLAFLDRLSAGDSILIAGAGGGSIEGFRRTQTIREWDDIPL